MHILALASRGLYYVIMGYGVCVCWQAFRASRKRAWLLLCCFCFSAFLQLGLNQIGKAIHRVPKERQEGHVVAADGRKVPIRRNRVPLPVFPFLLVAGLALLAREQAGDTAQP